MLVICGFCNCVLFINATVTEDFLQTGSLRTSLKEEADLGVEAGGKLRNAILTGFGSERIMAAVRHGPCLQVIALKAAACNRLRRAHP
eukprot:3202710-Pleurochrysis_carterae.AAC.1